MKETIRRDTLVEDLVVACPRAVPFLMQKNIQPIACGAPIWGTLEEAAGRHGYTGAEIDALVEELRALAGQAEGGG